MSASPRACSRSTNIRGGQPRFGTGSDTSFTPAELLLGAIAGCAAIDILASRRAEPDSFQVRAGADMVRDAGGNRLTGIVVTFQIGFPGGADGDEAWAILPDAVKKSHDRLCTVGRTVATGTPVTARTESPGHVRLAAIAGGCEGGVMPMSERVPGGGHSPANAPQLWS